MTTFDAYKAEKAMRGKSFRVQVIETLWLMLFFVVSFSAGALFVTRNGACR